MVAELRLRVEILGQVEEELTEDSVEVMAMLVTVLEEEEDVDCTTVRGRHRRANQWQNHSTFSRRRQHRLEAAEPIHEAPRLSRT